MQNTTHTRGVKTHEALPGGPAEIGETLWGFRVDTNEICEGIVERLEQDSWGTGRIFIFMKGVPWMFTENFLGRTKKELTQKLITDYSNELKQTLKHAAHSLAMLKWLKSLG